MSWTLYPTPDDPNNVGIDSMMDAIERAGKKNIIMFCASQDSGFQPHREPYPAKRCDPRTMKRIGSAGLHGERSSYVNPDEVDYLFPGEIAMSSENICTGSSASTALAAGLAGLILWCCVLQEKCRIMSETPKASTKAQDTMKEPHPRKPLQRAPSRLLPAQQSQVGYVDFQNHERMYGLFDSLRSSKENPLVNIASILHSAAGHDDPAGELVRLCKSKAQAFFEA
jgi:hypothetical protein